MARVDAVIALSKPPSPWWSPRCLWRSRLAPRVTDGGAVSDVVKLHVFGHAMATPVALLAVTLTSYSSSRLVRPTG